MVRWLAWRVGRRGIALLFFAFLDLVYSVSLFVPPAEAAKSSSLRFVASILPLPVWGTLWATAGLVCLVHAFRIDDKIGFAFAISIKVLWAAVFVIAMVTGAIERAYVGAAIWLAMAGWIAVISTWPEPPIMVPHNPFQRRVR